jgi:taurine transport system permease protein
MADEMAFRGGGFNPKPRPAAGPLAFVAVILFWQVASAWGWINPIFLPSPWSIALALAKMWQSGALVANLGASIYRIGLGWLFGSLCGLAVGLAMGLFSLARAVGLPMVSAFFPIPKIALLPLFILWLGIGESSKVVLIGLGVFFPTVISAYSGVDGVAKNLIRMGQSFNLTTASVIRKIVLPGALPSILAGFRVSSSIALLLVVSAEMVGAEQGIGAYVLTAGNLMQTDDLLAGIVVLSMLGLAIGAGLGAIERRFLHWR